MDFPDFEDVNDIQINDKDNNTTNNIDHQEDKYNFTNTNDNHNEAVPAYNNMSTDVNYNNICQNNEWASPIDPEEEKRIEARRDEEKLRRDRLNEKIKKELEDKQDKRKQAVEWLQRWDERRHNDIEKKKEFNKSNEQEFIKNRTEAKDSNSNPWDKVIENIQLKESDHKGVKDISRMKNVILQRKSDFVNMKIN